MKRIREIQASINDTVDALARVKDPDDRAVLLNRLRRLSDAMAAAADVEGRRAFPS